MTIYRVSDFKLTACIQTTGADDSLLRQGDEENSISQIQWQRLHENPEWWGCTLVKNQCRHVLATVKHRQLPDYAPVSQVKKKKNEIWTWLASVSVIVDGDVQTLADGYYFFNLEKAKAYCETAVLMICDRLGICFPNGSSIIVDETGEPIPRGLDVFLPDGKLVNASSFGWYETYIECHRLEYKHSPLGHIQVRPTVKYQDSNFGWQAIPCDEVKVLNHISNIGS